MPDPVSRAKFISRKLRFLMDTHRLTVPQLASSVDVKRMSLQEIVDGRAEPSESVLRRLANYFDLQVSYFVQDEPAERSDELNELDAMLDFSSSSSSGRSKSSGRPAPSSSGARSGRSAPKKPTTDALTLKGLAVRYQSLVEILVAKGVMTAAEYRDKVAEVETRR